MSNEPKIKVPMDVANVFREVTENDAGMRRVTRARVHPFLITLIEPLSCKHPTWEFISTDFGTHDTNADTYIYSRFEVRDQGEPIGTISRDNHWRTAVQSYEFNCARLDKKRARGNSTKTKDLKKALKLINANMYALTLEERTLKIKDTARTKLHSLHSNHYYKYRNDRDVLADSLAAFAFANWEEYRMTPVALGREGGARERILDAYEAYRGAETVVDAHNAKRGATVFQRGDNYYVSHDNASSFETQMYTLDTLPEVIKSAVALLKLLDDDKHVPEVGMRLDASAFYVVDGGVHELQQP